VDAFTTILSCSGCRADFRVGLSRMRLNYPNRCPSCGRYCEISSAQAIVAHRRLEWLEHQGWTEASALAAFGRPVPAQPLTASHAGGEENKCS
jgi:hypothetical protein